MPVMDGLEATRAIRARESGGRHVPIIALTANVMAEDRQACQALGMDDFVGKPVQSHTLGAALERARAGLDLRRATSAPTRRAG